ncbi:Bug family tripartite tricarboxylate transporter substrate binding protein [Bordetella petrii]|uniref:Bug family tripartite tricarboxylate transporter substrate binding protein n=1 Tax=Bordetella petrii TaxID=94624 RepID=UPI001E2E31E3|nr:tripartite tricarboxylate transporter substrate binding protein [Bordetella petrii]MCD0504525.1 tripartite tricarboxylate transporter substrate binding protein [Bordetella petrii]
MNTSLVIRMTAAILAGALSTSGAYAAGGKYPDRPVTIVVPFGAGGIADALPRIVGQELSNKWGVPVIIENKVGASGNIGMDYVARAKPDGYTLALAPAGNLTVNPLLYTKLPFDTARDFAPVTMLATSPNVLVVNDRVPAKTFKELVEYASQHPDKLNYSSPGPGSGAHLAGELLNQSAGIVTRHIPYNAMAAAVNDVVAGNVDMMFAGVSTVLPQIQAGKLRALAVAGPERLPQLKDVPTVAESGYPGFDVTSWYGIVAPAKVSPEILDKLQADIAAAVGQETVRQKFAGLGVTPAGSSRADFAGTIQDEARKWAEIVKKAGIQPIQ